MDKRFTMTVEEASRRYQFSADAIRQNVSNGNWRTLDIHRLDSQSRIWLDPYNFDVWFNWMKRYIAASEKERRSRKWFAAAAPLISVLGFLAFRPETLGAVPGTLAYGVIPTGLTWYLLRMRRVESPQYRHTFVSDQRGGDQDPNAWLQANDFVDPIKHCIEATEAYANDTVNNPIYSHMPSNTFYRSHYD